MTVKNLSLTELKNFIQALPIAELHVHLDGTLEPEHLFKLSKSNNLAIPYQSVEEIYAAYEFNDLEDFLKIYSDGAALLRTEQDFYQLCLAYLEKAWSENVCHAEMFVSPQTHYWKAEVDTQLVLDASIVAIKAMQGACAMTAGLIVNFNRSFVSDNTFVDSTWEERAALEAPVAAVECYEQVLEYLAKKPEHRQFILGFGLDHAERGFPPYWFTDLFNRIKADGFKTVAHAGEEGPVDYIKQVVDLLDVDRIDHGNNLKDDAALLLQIAQKEIPLTMCPLSNKALKVISTLAHYPGVAFLTEGLRVTINSDDPSYFRGYLKDNLWALASTNDLTVDAIAQLAKNSFLASFITEERKNHYISIIDEKLRCFKKTFQYDLIK